MEQISSSAALLHSLVLVFGFSSWLLVNAVWVELALIVETAPEGYGIASHMAIALQCANIFPLLYFLASRRRDPPLPYKITIPIICGVGAISCNLLARCWSITAPITPGGEPRSIFLIGLLFLGGALDCTSSVVYWPWVSQYDEAFTATLATGESLSGSIPALIGVAQAAADGSSAPLFGPSTFFDAMSAIQWAALASFLVICWRFPGGRRGGGGAGVREPQSGDCNRRASTGDWSEGERVNDQALKVEKGGEGSPVRILPSEMSVLERGEEAVDEVSSLGGDDDDGINLVLSDSLREGGGAGGKLGGVDEGIEIEGGSLWEVCAYPVLLEGLLKCVVDGLAPSLTPFAASGYDSPRQTLMWCIILSNLARPLGAHLTTYTMLRNRNLALQAVLWLVPWAFLLFVSVSFRNPPFKSHPWVLAALWAAGAGAAGYAHSMLFIEIGLRCGSGRWGTSAKQKGYSWAGVSTQAGAFVGTIVAFWLVNLSGWFAY